MVETGNFFSDIFVNARENSVIVMDTQGSIIEVSKSFTTEFGYKSKDVAGKHLRMLFTQKDKKLKKPENEVQEALEKGSKTDNNYLVHKDGTPIWVMGESVTVRNSIDEKYLVKIVHNIHAQKQLERFLIESTEFVDTIFNSIKDTSLVILDSGLKIVKTNKAFLKMFDLKVCPAEGTKLTQLENDFWQNAGFRKQLMDIIVTRKPLLNAKYPYVQKSGKQKIITVDTKLMDGEGYEKKILLVIKMSDPSPGS